MSKIQTSETKIIKRSQIHLNPFNPKHHGDLQIKGQVSNFKKVGFLGGIVWNQLTGNLIDGHRRVFAYDIVYKYDGTQATDYDIKVEVAFLDEKTEKEQMTYMAIANTKVDFEIIAGFIHEIDAKNAGITDVEMAIIDDFIKIEDNNPVEEFKSVLSIGESEYSKEKNNEEPDLTAEYEKKKEAVKQSKQQQNNLSKETYQNGNSYIMLSFKDYESKLLFCEHFNLKSNENTIAGEDFFEQITRNK